MWLQLFLGSVIIALTAVVSAISWWILESVLARTQHWVTRPPHGPKLTAILSLSILWTLLMMTASVWIWAAAFWLLGTFQTFEASVYFALVVFTTLGFGDVLLPPEWRLLGGLAAANGLLSFGILTAMLVETLRQTRVHQRNWMDAKGAAATSERPRG